MEKGIFQAEVNELLNLMIHSVYSNKEIFLRELISNASDAIDKLKFESLTNSEISAQEQFQIRLTPDSNSKTLVIEDNGIGMNKEDIVNYLGTIAKSGTKKFFEMKKDLQNTPELIGQFGIGFYSAFMVATKIEVTTKKATDSQAWKWISEGSGGYTIEESTRETHGTSIKLFLKSKEEIDDDFTEEWRLRSLVKKYSDFISHPIVMKVKKSQPVLDADGKEVEGKQVETMEDEILNSQRPLWTKSASEISSQEYNEFYKHITHDWNDPAHVIHYKAEGTQEFTALMYLPSQPPFNFNFKDFQPGLNLYVKRVFIMDHCKDLIPEYLRFVQGMVDSSDLSLNVSREILQQDRQVSQMKKSITTKILSFLLDLMKRDRVKYEEFYAHFGKVLKEGIPSDILNKEKLENLLVFNTTNGDSLTSLKQYVERMKKDQKFIYFITGESLDQMRKSPHLELLLSQGFEVLLMNDAIDEWVVDHITQFENHKLQSVTKGDIEVGDEDSKKKIEEEMKTYNEQLKPIISLMTETLKDHIKEVRLSKRLKNSPVCLVSGDNDPSAHLERILASHKGETYNQVKRILEINPHHQIFNKMMAANKETQEQWADLLYNQALLTEGSNIKDPFKFSETLNKLMMNMN